MPSVILATAGYDQTIKFWEAPTGVCYRTWPLSDARQINSLAITPDKKYIAAASNPTVRLYDINSKGTDPLISYEGHTGNVTTVGFQKDGKWMYTGSEDGTLKIWDLRASGCQRDYDCKAAVNAVALHANQAELVSGDQGGKVQIWDLTKNGFRKHMTPEGTTPIRSVCAAADASMIIASNNHGNCFIWKPKATGDYEAVKSLDAHKSHVLKCVLSPDVKWLATASSDCTVRVWNVADWSLKTTLVGHQRWVWSCVFSADSTYLVTASSDANARLWELVSGEVVRVYKGHRKAVTTVALNDSSA